MKDDRKEELMVRWMDNQLNEAEKLELERFLEAEPELRGMAQEHANVKASLQEVYTKEELPYGDFFQSKLTQAIREEERAAQPSAKKALSWRDSLKWWLAPMTVGAMALAFLAGTKVTTPTTQSIVTTKETESVVYTPEGGVSSAYVREPAMNTSLIVLNGLQPLSDNLELLSDTSPSESDAGYQMIRAAEPSAKTRTIY